MAWSQWRKCVTRNYSRFTCRKNKTLIMIELSSVYLKLAFFYITIMTYLDALKCLIWQISIAKVLLCNKGQSIVRLWAQIQCFHNWSGTLVNYQYWHCEDKCMRKYWCRHYFSYYHCYKCFVLWFIICGKSKAENIKLLSSERSSRDMHRGYTTICKLDWIIEHKVTRLIPQLITLLKPNTDVMSQKYF